MLTNLQIFFHNLFPAIILENKIVATIIYNLGIEISNFKDTMDNTLNHDI